MTGAHRAEADRQASSAWSAAQAKESGNFHEPVAAAAAKRRSGNDPQPHAGAYRGSARSGHPAPRRICGAEAPQLQSLSDAAGTDHQHLTWILRGTADPARAAHALLDEFGHFGRALGGAASRQLRATGDIAAVRALAQFRAAMLFAAHARVSEGTILACWSDFIAYIRLEIAHDPYEQLHVTFLNLRNELILTERVASGTIDECRVPTRDIIGRAIEIGAASLILAHNHPTGNVEPSSADKEMTRRLALCGRQLNLAIYDHIIVGRNAHTSFRELGLI